MRTEYMSRLGKSRILIGLFLFFVGTVFLIQNLRIADVSFLFQFWPLILILMGIIHLLEHRSFPGIVWSTILFLIGVGFLLPVFGINVHVLDFWPLILVLLGIGMIVKGVRSASCSQPPMKEEQSRDSYVLTTVFMGGVRKVVFSSNLLGGELTATLGGIQLDLRDSEIHNEATFDVFVLMGGIEILIPQEWKVLIDASPILGGISDSTVVPKLENPKLIHIKGTVILGGVEIKNYSEEDWVRARR
ncbi:MAG: cell wall-active antibiotics response protein [Bacteroidetes bacterium]|nr:cell wall-active antibiotics response protein [Bacteroidota bacterium]